MGRGIIRVGQALFETPPKEEEESTKQPQSLAEWRELLMLPETFELLEAKLDPMYPYWSIIVESKAIPVVEVSPIYIAKGNKEDGTSTYYLDRIEVYAPEKKAIWQRSEQ